MKILVYFFLFCLKSKVEMSFVITGNDWEEINKKKDCEGFVSRIQVACELIIALSLEPCRWDLACSIIN